MEKIGFGGGCHWCTEAVFQSLNGVEKVEQGWISSFGNNESFSEGIIVYFDPKQIDLLTLISIHLHTHSSTSAHSMRGKYRSAVYTFAEKQSDTARQCITLIQKEFDKPIITKSLAFNEFKLNKETYLDYYYKNPDNPFCQTHINPKLSLLMNKFSNVTDKKKLTHII